MSKKTKYLFFGIILAGIGWMVSDAFLQPGVDDLKGDLKELAFVRNEQNTGPIVRIYAVSVKDTLWSSMNSYGNYMPHTKYGITRVFYFLDDTPLPGIEDLDISGDNLSDKYKSYCIARYEKNMMGNVLLTRYPFKNSKNGTEKQIY